MVIFVTFIYLIAWKIKFEKITKNAVETNQMLWDEYSKNMTQREREDCFGDWLLRRKRETNSRFYNIPWIHNAPYKYYDIQINGNKYKLTKEEIAEKLSVPIEELNNGMPEIVYTDWKCPAERDKIISRLDNSILDKSLENTYIKILKEIYGYDYTKRRGI